MISNSSFQTPILFLIFNRPALTSQVFDRIKSIRPKYLFIAADGPRFGKNGETMLCEESREIATRIDWECEVKTLFRETNLGSGKAVSEAITWFFEHVKQGVILEDDCCPSLSFFPFCEDLLNKYEKDLRIWQISGFNAFYRHNYIEHDSYLFSDYGSGWGWATWRTRWLHYDLDYKIYRSFANPKNMKRLYGSEKKIKNEKRKILELESKKVDTWDYQWGFTRRMNHGLCIIPNRNLIRNIGFGPDSTHTKNRNDIRRNVSTSEIKFPLSHPNYIFMDKIQDQLHMESFGDHSIYNRIKRRIKRMINSLFFNK